MQVDMQNSFVITASHKLSDLLNIITLVAPLILSKFPKLCIQSVIAPKLMKIEQQKLTGKCGVAGTIERALPHHSSLYH
jgi:hypothetical protein